MLDWIFTKFLQLCILTTVFLLSPIIVYAILESEYKFRKSKR